VAWKREVEYFDLVASDSSIEEPSREVAWEVAWKREVENFDLVASDSSIEEPSREVADS